MASEQLLVTVGLSATKFKNEMKGLNSDLKSAEQNFKITEKSAQLMENRVEGVGKKLQSLNKVYDAQTKKLEAYQKRLTELGNTKKQLEANDINLKARLTELNTALDQAVSKYGANSKQANELRNEISSLEKEIAKNGRAMDSTNGQYDRLAREMQTTGLEAEYTQQRINGLENEFNNLDTNVKKIDLEGFTNKLKSIGEVAAQVGRKINDVVLTTVGEAINGVGKGVQFVGSSISQLGHTMNNSFTVPYKRLKQESIPVFREFEKSMSALEATTGATGKEMKEFEKKALELGGSTQKSAIEVAEAMRYQALAGWKSEQILESTLPILNLSVAGNIDLARASDLVTDSMSSLSVKTKDLGTYLDQVAQTSRSANTDMDVMMEAFIKAGGSAKVLKINTIDLGAAIGLLANSGFKGAEGGRALQTVLNRIGANKDVKDTLNGIGVAVYDDNKEFRGLEAVIGDVHEKFKTMSTEQKAELAKKIAGENYYSQFITLVDSMGGSFQELQGQIGSSNGVLQEMTNIMGDNLDGKIKRTESAFEQFQITLAASSSKTAALKADLAYLALSGFNKLPGPIKKVLIMLANLIAIIGPLLIAIGGFITVIGLAVSKIGLFIAALAGCAAPMAAVAYLVGALIAAFIKFKDEITSAMENMLISVGSSIGQLKETFSTMWDTLKSAWDTIGQVTIESMKVLIVGACDIIAGIFPSISNAFGVVVNILSDLWNSYGVPLFQGIQTVIQIAVDFIVQCLPGISTVFNTVMSVIQTIYNSVFKPVFDGIKQVAGMVIDWFKQYSPILSKTFNSVMDTMNKYWNSIGKPMWEFLKTVISGAIQFVLPIIQTLLKVFGATVNGIASLWNGILKPVFDKLIEVAGWVMSKALPPIQSFKDGVCNAMNAVLQPIQWVIDKFNSLFNWAGKVGSSIGKFMDKLNPFKSAVANLPEPPAGYSMQPVDEVGLSTLDLNHQMYRADTPFSLGLNNVLNSREEDTNVLLKKLIKVMKNNSNNNDGGITIQIDNFNNNRQTDVQTLAEELEFYRKNSRLRGVY